MPDLERFKINKLDGDIVALMSQRVFDIAATTKGVAVFLNGKELPIKTFNRYVELYAKNENGSPIPTAYEKSGNWKVAICMSDGGHRQMSFVNSIATTGGGAHVNYVVDKIMQRLNESLMAKRNSTILMKSYQLRSHIWAFINCTIENPSFKSQLKESLAMNVKKLYPKCSLSEAFYDRVGKLGIVEAIEKSSKFKEDNEIFKTSAHKSSAHKSSGTPKLLDARNAGGEFSHMCTLIITEGDSAMTFAMSGLAVLGRVNYGIFPLRGKFLNVRGVDVKQLAKNAEIANLCKIINLQLGKKYATKADLKTLRYGKIMIMADQDHDGSHIKGLVINFIHTLWPDLLRVPFLEEFITPIVNCLKRSDPVVVEFFFLFNVFGKNATNVDYRAHEG